MALQIRPVTANDASFLAEVMLMATRSHLSRGPWDLVINGSDEVCLAYLKCLAVTKMWSWCHYSSFIVAEVDKRPVSALCSYDPARNGMPSLMQAMQEVSSGLGQSQGALEAALERLEPFMTCVPEQPEGMWIIENVATVPEFRRQGLCNALLEAILEKGRQEGYQQSQIAVFIGNTPAIRAYEKVGFKVADEKRTPEFEAVIHAPGIVRLLRSL
ncbi:MAG: GNAT family N-acetyltransferase [Ktedonobacteraceae bacterium]